jgi:hypothetical protein
MNDLTFGAALLACFVTLASAAFAPAAPARKTAAAQNPPQQIALAGPANCLAVAQAPLSR